VLYVFTNKVVYKGQFLTYDYDYSTHSVRIFQKFPCLCGSRLCTGHLNSLDPNNNNCYLDVVTSVDITVKKKTKSKSLSIFISTASNCKLYPQTVAIMIKKGEGSGGCSRGEGSGEGSGGCSRG